MPVNYQGAVLSSGIQFKSDPGLPITYSSFFILMLGALFVALPELRIWGSIEALEQNNARIILGFSGLKGANLMKRDLRKLERAFIDFSDRASSPDEKLEVSRIDA